MREEDAPSQTGQIRERRQPLRSRVGRAARPLLGIPITTVNVHWKICITNLAREVDVSKMARPTHDWFNRVRLCIQPSKCSRGAE